jgi:hypothetical protein
MKTTTVVRAVLHRHPVWTVDAYEREFTLCENELNSFAGAVAAAAFPTDNRPPAADNPMLLAERLGNRPEQTITSIRTRAEQLVARADADRAELRTLLDGPLPIPTREQIAARAYWAPMAQTALDACPTELDVVHVVEAQLAQLLGDPDRAAAWADIVDTHRIVVAQRVSLARIPSPSDMSTAARLQQLVLQLRTPSWPAEHQTAAELLPRLVEIRNLAVFVYRSAAARVNALIARPTNGATQQRIEDQFAGVWRLGWPAPRAADNWQWSDYRSVDEVRAAYAGAYGLTRL